MSEICHDSPAAGPPFGFTPAQVEAIRSHLSEVLESPAFRASGRSKQFLECVVEHALAGNLDRLKERSLGNQLFNRPPDYDTGADAIVRVKANEVRKRLDQYYRESGDVGGVTIELPPGSYVPRFRLTEASSAAMVVDTITAEAELLQPGVVDPAWTWITPWVSFPNARRVWWVAGLVALCLVAATGVAAWRGAHTSAFEQLWEPVAHGPGNPVICIGTSDTFMVARQLQFALDKLSDAEKETAVPIKPKDIAHLRNFHISIGNFNAVQALARTVRHIGKEAEIRWGGQLRPEDLRGQPVILVGGFSNDWTMKKSAEWRFRFMPGYAIRDMWHPDRHWNIQAAFPWKPQTEDFCLVSRVLGPRPGEVYITVAGVNTFGTEAGAEFLCDPASWNQLNAKLPKGWQKKNLQFVLHTDVVGVTPGPATIIDYHVW